MARATREFQVFAKPAGAACNLECRYCYYLDKGDLHPGLPRGALMPPDLLERYIVQHIEAAPGTTVAFSWHGGEPTLAGIDYFRTIVEIQRKHRRPGTRIVNGIQTNGILLDERWAGFLAEEGFRVGLSLDGPADLHDRYRVTRGHEPTHARVMRAFDLLKRRDVPTDILAVVHAANVVQPLAVYRFFRRIGAASLSLLPLVRLAPGTREEAERGGDGAPAVTPESVPADAYGRFLCAVFDEWVERDTARIQVQLFDEATRPTRGLPHSLCIFRPTCGDIPVVERNGDVYSCDHFADAAHLVGNIARTSLADILEGPAQRRFGQAKQETLPRQCRECGVLPMCNGGCPKDRFAPTADGEGGLNYLCPAFKAFFTHVLPYAVKLAAEDPARARLLRMVEQAEASGERRAPATGRNEPCPCGSGRKFKKCCGA